MEDHRMAIEELVRGRGFANQLRQVISGDDESAIGTPFAQHLVKNVLRSFTNTIFLLDKFPPYKSHEVSQMPKRESSLISPAKSEDSQQSCRSSTDKCRRGCYKRRKTTQTWEKVSEIPEDDGHLWRKYGQKEILNAKYSRSYYRCTYKFDQRCQATKQVQRIQEKPPLYRTIYYFHHTCKNTLNPDIILDPNSPSDSSILLSFNNNYPTPTKQDCHFVSSSSSPSQSVKEDVSSSSLDDYLLSPEPTTFDNLSRHVTLSSTLESYNRDLLSSFLCDSVELDDVFQYFVQF